jgi:hypothetical protein
MASSDNCHHCGLPYEIIHVGFRLRGTVMIATCPNCSMFLESANSDTANDVQTMSRLVRAMTVREGAT